MVFLDGEITEYYCWFIQKRFNLTLNKPLRGAHISFINDSNQDLITKNNCTPEQANVLWERVKDKWDGVEIPILLDLRPRFDKKHWWLNVHPDYRDRLQGIRDELNLGRPYYGMHMSLGYANEKQYIHHEYITKGIIDNFIQI